MKIYLLHILLLLSFSCHQILDSKQSRHSSAEADSLSLAKMISTREEAMIAKNVNAVIPQFANDATWINSQGYLFQGKDSIVEFHNMLARRDSLDYFYKAGIPRIRITDASNALVYYGWKMFWFKPSNPADTLYKEIGLMSLTAQKRDETWRWIAVTNQHTPWFYDEITPVSIE